MNNALKTNQFEHLSSRAIIHRAERYAVIAAICFVILLSLAAAFSDHEELFTQLRRLDIWLLLGMLLLSLVNYTVRAARWYIFSRRLGLTLPPPLLGLYYFAGFSMTTTPGKLGEFLRLWLLKRGHGYRYERTLNIMIGDRLSDVLAVMLICLVGMTAFGDFFWAVVISTSVILIANFLFLQPVYGISVINFLYSLVQRWPKLFVRLRRIVRHAGQLGSPAIFGSALGLAIIGWLSEALAFYWLLQALDIDISFIQAAFIFCFSMIIGGVAMLPGGLGGAEASMAGLLVMMGVELQTAVAATVIIRLTTLWFAVGLGFLALPFALRKTNQPANVKAVLT